MNYKNHVVDFILILLLVWYSLQYMLFVDSLCKFGYSVVVDFILFLIVFIGYMRIYRRDNFFCFEFLFLFMGLMGAFFRPLILPLVFNDIDFYSVGIDIYQYKAYVLQLIAYLMLLLGCSRANNKAMLQNQRIPINCTVNSSVNWDRFMYFLTIIILILIIYDYQTGVFQSWFYYSNSDVMDVEDRNEGLGHLTCLLVSASMVEIVRLRNLGIATLKESLKKCNKVFIVEWLIISFLLFVSGNRNEMLLVFLPLVVAYSICIKKINNKIYFATLVAGVIAMIIAGATRQNSVSLDGGSLKLSSFVVDFATLTYNCEYLLYYTDQYGCTYFADLPNLLLSGIPFLGGKLIDLLQFTTVKASAIITTEGAGTISGMGTSLVGDLYYSAGFLWVLVFMCFIGYLMSSLYYMNRYCGIYRLTFYSYMLSNAVYYARSSWAFPITIIEYVFVIILLGTIIFRKV